jgi:translation initiation factor 5B
MAFSIRDQAKEAIGIFDEKYWRLVGQLAEYDFNVERYDKVKDFTKEIALVPISARDGEGIQDLLAVVIGLAERYLSEKLSDIEGLGEGTVLEVKEERGLGKTLDVILHRGSIKKGDEIVLVTSEGGISTRVKGMFSPRGMSEMPPSLVTNTISSPFFIDPRCKITSNVFPKPLSSLTSRTVPSPNPSISDNFSDK